MGCCLPRDYFNLKIVDEDQNGIHDQEALRCASFNIVFDSVFERSRRIEAIQTWPLGKTQNQHLFSDAASFSVFPEMNASESRRLSCDGHLCRPLVCRDERDGRRRGAKDEGLARPASLLSPAAEPSSPRSREPPIIARNVHRHGGL